MRRALGRLPIFVVELRCELKVFRCSGASEDPEDRRWIRMNADQKSTPVGFRSAFICRTTIHPRFNASVAESLDD